MSQSALSSAYGQRIALIRKHFPPGLPRYTPPAAGRGWRARMVDVAAGNGDVLCSLERRRSAGAAACLRCPPCHARWPDRGHACERTGRTGRTDRGAAHAAGAGRDCTASTGDCWCACNRILSPHPSSRWRPARRRCVGGAWRWAPCSFWRRCLPCCGGGSGIPWRRRPLRPLLPCPCPCPYRCLCLCRCQNQDPNKPEPKPEPKRDSEWPTELAFVLETSDRMSSQPNKRGGLSRTAIGRGEIQRIVGRLPKDTDTQLFTFPAGECRSPVGHGVFPAQKRPDLLKTVQGAPDDGKPPWSKASRWRRHPWTASSATPWFSCSWEVRTRAARTSART